MRKSLIILYLFVMFGFSSLALSQGNHTQFDDMFLGSFYIALLAAFFTGIISSLTPCVYPVIPIVISVIGSQKAGSKFRGFMLSLYFVLGLSFVYSTAGLFAARSGAIIGGLLQNTALVILICLVFLLMGFSLIGLFEIRLPAFISSKLSPANEKRGIAATFLAGCVTGIVAVPCIGPFIISVSAVASGMSLLKGFMLFFSFSFGLGLIFLVIGTFTSVLTSLPRPGLWMVFLKKIFGIVIIAVSIYYFSFIVSEPVFSIVFSITLFLLAFLFPKLKDMGSKGLNLFHKRLAQFFSVGGFVVLIAFIFSNQIPVQQHNIQNMQETPISWVKNEKKALDEAREENKVILIDFYADWCPGCKELEKFTFSDERIIDKSKELVFLKVDLTRSNDYSVEISKKYEILGLPTIVFLDKTGKIMKDLTISGFVTAREMLSIIEKAQKR